MALASRRPQRRRRRWLLLALLITLIVLAVKAVSGAQPGSSGGALELLKRRFAAGEITQDEYEKTRRILEG